MNPHTPPRAGASRPRRAGSSLGPAAETSANSAPSVAGSGPDITLLAVTGMSPAVLTETIWALAHESEPVIPSRVIVATTLAGRREIERQLFQPLSRFGGRCAWDTLRECLAAQGHPLQNRLQFGTTASDVRVITAADPATGRSHELDDLRTPADNDAAADFLLDLVRSVVENPDTQLVASIAGGRKTMGALLYACLTLAGRETDRLTHVLVSEPYETLREFYFPGQPGGSIDRPWPGSGGVGQPLDPAGAEVELASLPFVPLRNLFARELGRNAGTFSRLLQTCRDNVRQRAAESIRLSVDTTRTEIEVNGKTIKLAPLEHLLLLFLARRAKHGEPAYTAYKDAVADIESFRLEQVAARKSFADWRHADSLKQAWDEREITKAASSLRDKLRQRGRESAILAACLPEKGRCSLDVPAALIHLK